MAPILTRDDDDELTAAVSGEFDMAATFTLEPALERAIEAPELRRLTLDLSDVTFIDSTGIGVVLWLAAELETRDVVLRIVPGPPEVQRVSRRRSGRRLAVRRLTYSDIGIYCRGMARAATTADAFNAVAEPRRREIIDVLAGGERPVNDLVRELGVTQPQVSKHLRVLREVGAVDVREAGRQRLYRSTAAR